MDEAHDKLLKGDEACRVDFAISGMTCASCAARIEKKLNRLEGVQAAVNYASERATVEFNAALISMDDLVGTVEAAGYGAVLPENDQQGSPREGYGVRLVVAVVLTVPLVAFAWITPARFSGWQWLSLVLATPVVFWCGWPFHRAALKNLLHRSATMDTLISVGTLAAWTWSSVVLVVSLRAPIYFDTAAAITTLILLGRFLELRAKVRSGDALKALRDIGPVEARLLEEDSEVLVPLSRVKLGDLFVVHEGEKVPTDGRIEIGRGLVDESLLTGESVPREVGPLDFLTGGTTLVEGRLVVSVTAVGENTKLSQIVRLVEQAQATKAPIQRLADRVSGVFVPTVLTVAAVSLAGWLLLSHEGVANAFSVAVAVIVIACPCALGLATPTALIVGTGRGAQLGILVRGPDVLEESRRVTTVVFDKTGTVTEGRMAVEEFIAADGVDGNALVALVAAAESRSAHPIAVAIVDWGHLLLGNVGDLDSINNYEGAGVSAVVAGHLVVCARPSRFGESSEWETLGHQIGAWEEQGATVVAVAVDGHPWGAVALRDRTRVESKEVVARLKRQGVATVLLTGDNLGAAARVAREIGIERVIAGVMPEEKEGEIARLQAGGEVVAMVGDGTNDAPALARADLGIAMASGTDVAIQASDITLVTADLLRVVDALALSRATFATIKGNLWWAFGYNIVAIPLAVAGLVNPIFAAGAMAFSSVFVVSNSLRLRRFDPNKERP